MDFSWYQIIGYAVAALGGAAGLAKMFTFAVERWDRRKKRIAAEIAERLSASVEIKRLDLEDARLKEVDIKEALWKLLKDKEAEADKLKAEINELKTVSSLSRPVITKIYAAVRDLRRQIGIIDDVMSKIDCSEVEKATLTAEIEVLRDKFAKLEEALP